MDTYGNKMRLLNDLILINNDRMVGYQKAMDELKVDDSDLKILFQENINQSNEFRSELAQKLTKNGYKDESGITNAGKSIEYGWISKHS